jgi:hypothetical protein
MSFLIHYGKLWNLGQVKCNGEQINLKTKLKLLNNLIRFIGKSSFVEWTFQNILQSVLHLRN